MFTNNVQSDRKPEALAYFLLPSGIADVYIRDNVHMTDGEEGQYYEYDETYFQTTETREDIEENLDTWKEYGAAWEQEVVLTQAEIISRLQAKTEQNRSDIDYIAAMSDIELEG